MFIMRVKLLPSLKSWMVLLLEVCTMELNGTHILRYTLGETIPIRLFLGGFELTPTFRGKKKKEVK